MLKKIMLLFVVLVLAGGLAMSQSADDPAEKKAAAPALLSNAAASGAEADTESEEDTEKTNTSTNQFVDHSVTLAEFDTWTTDKQVGYIVAMLFDMVSRLNSSPDPKHHEFADYLSEYYIIFDNVGDQVGDQEKSEAIQAVFDAIETNPTMTVPNVFFGDAYKRYEASQALSQNSKSQTSNGPSRGYL